MFTLTRKFTMCGRFVQALPTDVLIDIFKVEKPLPELPTNYNLAPKQEAAVIRLNPDSGKRVVTLLDWGLVPSWADENHKYSTINAKAEELTGKRFYKGAWESGRRCIIPVTAFYEWQQVDEKHKQPYAIARQDGEPLALAGLWEGKKLDGGHILRTFTIITCAANADMETIHHRMPVVLDKPQWSVWLGEKDMSLTEVAKLMPPSPADTLKLWPVDKQVGNTRNHGAELLEPITV